MGPGCVSAVGCWEWLYSGGWCDPGCACTGFRKASLLCGVVKWNCSGVTKRSFSLLCCLLFCMDAPPEKLTGAQLIKKFPVFYGTRRFIIAFTTSRHLFLSWARSVHSMPPDPTSMKVHFNIILPSTPGSSNIWHQRMWNVGLTIVRCACLMFFL